MAWFEQLLAYASRKHF